MKRIKKFNNFGRKTNEAYDQTMGVYTFGDLRQAKILVQKLTEYVNWMEHITSDKAPKGIKHDYETASIFEPIALSITDMYNIYTSKLKKNASLSDSDRGVSGLNDLD